MSNATEGERDKLIISDRPETEITFVEHSVGYWHRRQTDGPGNPIVTFHTAFYENQRIFQELFRAIIMDAHMQLYDGSHPLWMMPLNTGFAVELVPMTKGLSDQQAAEFVRPFVAEVIKAVQLLAPGHQLAASPVTSTHATAADPKRTVTWWRNPIAAFKALSRQ